MKKPTNWEIIALLTMGYKPKEIVKKGYPMTAYIYSKKLEKARERVKEE